MYGSYATIEDKPTLIFERRLSHPVDRVWQAITEPDELVHWFPSKVDVDDCAPGGAMRFEFEDMPLAAPSTHDRARHRVRSPAGVRRLLGARPPTRTTCGSSSTRSTAGPGARCASRWRSARGTRPRATRPAGTCASIASSGSLAARTGPAVTGATGDWRALYEEYQRRGAPVGAAIPGER